jgi:hypothetical protein
MAQTPLATTGLSTVVYNQGVFVTVGTGGTIFTSADGIAWQQRASLGPILWNVKYVNGTFMAVGDNGAIFQSGSIAPVPTPTPTPGPTITSQPEDATAFLGGIAPFSVQASGGSSPLRYQWYRVGGSPILGANSSTYLVGGATLEDEGGYYVIVTDANGSAATSRQARLTVVDLGLVVAHLQLDNNRQFATFPLSPSVVGTQKATTASSAAVAINRSQVLHISISDMTQQGGGVLVELRNSSGVLLPTTPILTEKNSTAILYDSSTPIPAGTYFVTARVIAAASPFQCLLTLSGGSNWGILSENSSGRAHHVGLVEIDPMDPSRISVPMPFLQQPKPATWLIVHDGRLTLAIAIMVCITWQILKGRWEIPRAPRPKS